MKFKFVLVNGRTPFQAKFCELCCAPISESGYLRDIRTRLCYCGAECYALKSGTAVMLFENRRPLKESARAFESDRHHEVHPGQS